MPNDFSTDITTIASIAAVPTILDVVCRTTGMGFAAVARVTPERWMALAVQDSIDFGLQPGGELKVDTTICHEVRENREPSLIGGLGVKPPAQDFPVSLPRVTRFSSRSAQGRRMMGSVRRDTSICFTPLRALARRFRTLNEVGSSIVPTGTNRFHPFGRSSLSRSPVEFP